MASYGNPVSNPVSNPMSNPGAKLGAMLLLVALPLGLAGLAAAPYLYRSVLDQQLRQERDLRDSLAKLADRTGANRGTASKRTDWRSRERPPFL